jgi:hypothetical protein
VKHLLKQLKKSKQKVSLIVGAFENSIDGMHRAISQLSTLPREKEYALYIPPNKDKPVLLIINSDKLEEATIDNIYDLNEEDFENE